RGDREFAHHLNIAFGSFSEVKYLLHFAQSIGYLASDAYARLEAGYDELGKRLWSFYHKVKGD
ncbi:MAG: four helix bundle protein, partial [Candidatus Dadabacteria bacterium]